jgi:8-oxo-dGTP pyrophosphatase MutT (NUDIX family)
MQSIIDVTVAAIVARDDRFLIVEEQAGGRIVFNQPAGHLEPGESLTDAVVRETREETGFHFVPDRVVGVYLWHCDEAARSFLRVTFAGAARDPQTPPVLDEGIVAAHWLTRHQLLSRERQLRSPMVLQCLDDFQAGARYPLDCLQHLTPKLDAQARLA